ncbi:MAG: RNA polymerase subunit sigma-70 [Kofleriaceae bacterium]|nr:RNA polymerase subunit sigma-70 [Kofleriaceae bacterium]
MKSEAEFGAAVAPLRGALRLHCYRMLGSASDGDDMVQETLLRAWRARDTLQDPARLKPWLYRIATNVCLDEIARRPRRGLASDLFEAVPGDSYPPAAPIEAGWLEPMPDAWLAGIAQDPEARYLLRESVALAFVAALQVLTPSQRAALLLCDVVGMSAGEVASTLDQSVAATHSVLHRARDVIEAKVAAERGTALAPEAESVLQRYVKAIADADVEAMIAIIHDDMHTTMPPSPTWVRGRADNVEFYRRMFARWWAGDVRVVPVGVNGALGCEFHRDGALRAIEAIEVRDGKVLRMHHFMQPAVVALFRNTTG